jgi:hypothetical protein
MTLARDTLLWRTDDLECVMVSCCAGAELQMRRRRNGSNDFDIVLRELYPTKSDLYERSRDLEVQHLRPDL